MSLSRRDLSLGLAAAALTRCGPATLSPTGVFPLGVASGDPAPQGIVLWTRYTGAAPLSVALWPAGTNDVRTLSVTPDANGFVSLDVGALQSATDYGFAFRDAAEQQSAVGRFRTAPDLQARPVVTIGATCCTKYGNAFDVLARAGQRSDLDAFLLLGDTIYADGAHTVEDFRGKWQEAFLLPEYQALKASTALVATWDDHEFNNDWARDTLDPGRFTAGSTAWFEHIPMRRNPDLSTRVWRRVRFGTTAEVFVLDCRSERYRSKGQYISPAQLDWLKRGLSSSPCTFKLIMSSVPISQFAVPFFEPFSYDRWEGFPVQRTDILTHIDDAGIPGVLWVAGDFHLACAGRVSLDGPGRNAVEVLVGPGGQVPNASPSYPSAPQFEWSSGINNYTEFSLDPSTGRAKVTWIDASGAVLYTQTYAL
jgi:alkaline phosphatase D